MVDPKLQVWDPLTQRYAAQGALFATPGVVYRRRDLNNNDPINTPPDPADLTLRQRGRWDDRLGYIPNRLMPPIVVDPDDTPEAAQLAEVIRISNRTSTH